MRFKVVPLVEPRYWIAISLASICGCNLGDVVPDVFKMSTASGLILLGVLFAAVVVLDRLVDHRTAAPYWMSILIVRAAATELADLFIGRIHLSYILATCSLAFLLLGVLAIGRRLARAALTDNLPQTGGSYWLAMLTAGTLGTVVADGIGHTIQLVTIGVPICAAMATAVIALILQWPRRAEVVPAASLTYWATIVAIRVWGTSVGDISAFLLSLPLSLMLSGAVLAVTLLTWREPSEPNWPVVTNSPLS